MLICTYLNMLYTRQVRVVAVLVRLIPMLRTNEPFMAPSMTEDVLRAALDLGPLAVVLPLLVCQGMVTTALLTDDKYHTALPDFIVLRHVAGIEIQGLVLVFLLDEGLDDVGVMDTGIRGDVLLNEFCFLVGLDMLLVTVMNLVAFLGPAGINVLAAFLIELALPFPLALIWLRVPKFTAPAILDGGVLLTGVALPRSFNK